MTTCEVGTGRWCELAMASASVLPERRGLGWRIQVDARAGTDHRRWHQVVQDGRVVAWSPGDLDRPDLELRWSLDVARAVHRGELSGTGAMAALRVVCPGGGEGPAPPLDIVRTREAEALPVLPGATLTVQYELGAGPFGDVSSWMSFDDGRIGSMGFGRAEACDVELHLPFGNMVRVRTGAITILEALDDGGQVRGDLGPLMLLAGLEESPELHAAELACGPAGTVLAAVGALRSTPEHRELRRALAAVTA